MIHHRATGRRTPTMFLQLTGLVLLLAVSLLLIPGSSRDTLAKAPPHATSLVLTSVYAAPDWMSQEIGTLTAGTQIELTGDAAPGFLGVLFGDGEAWVPATNMTTGVRPGVDTAIALEDTQLLAAPFRDSGLVTYVPEGESVILTGASVDGFYAASWNGMGGWVSGREIAR
ncbi:MAG: hypothetical protein QM692_01065 [Thermomicrobiales bacterium]